MPAERGRPRRLRASWRVELELEPAAEAHGPRTRSRRKLLHRAGARIAVGRRASCASRMPGPPPSPKCLGQQLEAGEVDRGRRPSRGEVARVVGRPRGPRRFVRGGAARRPGTGRAAPAGRAARMRVVVDRARRLSARRADARKALGSAIRARAASQSRQLRHRLHVEIQHVAVEPAQRAE